MQKHRIEYFDFLRGIGIMMVVGIHTAPALKDFDSIESIIVISIRQILNCSVPLFLAISGYFIAKKDLSEVGNRKRFWKKQIPTVYIPCFVWSLGWFILDIFGSRDNNVWYSLIKLIACGYSVYYFIALIIQFYLLLPWLSQRCSSLGIIISALVSAISIIIVTWMLQIEGKTFPLVVYAGPFVLWIVFFVMGIHYATHPRSYSLWPSALVMVIGLLASTFESLYYLPMHGGGMGIKLSSFVYSFGVIQFLFSKKIERLYSKNAFTNTVLKIGEISFAIYLIHMYVCIAVSYTKINSWGISWILTLLITLGLIAVAKMVLPKCSHRYLGLR